MTRSSLEGALPWHRSGSGPDRAPGVLETLASEILDRCRGEGPPNCQARCPLGVDIRRQLQLTGEGRFAEALQVVREKLPFPGVLGFVCAHPCEGYCKRLDQDEAVRVRDLERFLAEQEDGCPRHVLRREPDTGRHVAVIGGGPAGLVAAHDLRRRGHRVTVFEAGSALGGCLRDRIPEWRLPRVVMERDLSIIAALGIEVRTEVVLGRDVELQELRAAHAAVMLCTGFAGAARLSRRWPEGLARHRIGTFAVNPLTCETNVEGVFAAGDGVTGPATVVQAMAQGRRGAESVHRLLTGTDLRSDRDGVRARRLLWPLEVSDQERVSRQRSPTMLEPAAAPMARDEAREEASRCLGCRCGLCVEDCEFLETYGDSPKAIARRILEQSAGALKMIYSCSLCGLCGEVCPEGLDSGRLVLEARRSAVRRGAGPMPQHRSTLSYFRIGVSKALTSVMVEPGRGRSKRLFFTGCVLPEVSPGKTVFLYDQLRRAYPGVGVLMYCCGAPVEALGMEEAFRSCTEELLRCAESVGAEELVAACPECMRSLRSNVPELQVTSAWELLADVWEPPRRRNGLKVAVHDSCTARHEPGVQRAIRSLISRAGAEVEEIEYCKEKARCCGFGGRIFPVDRGLSGRIAARRASESRLAMVTYCAGCRVALARQGKDAVHLLDFLASPEWQAVARSRPPGGIMRVINRARAKVALRRLLPFEGR